MFKLLGVDLCALFLLNCWKLNLIIMALSESGARLRQVINKAIEDHIITPEEYDEIINISLEDGHIDSQEKALLKQLQQMIENKEVTFSRNR